MLLGADAGLTTGETARLEWENIELSGDVLRVHGREILASERLTDTLRAWANRSGAASSSSAGGPRRGRSRVR